MIISDNSKSEKIRFQSLISRMDKLLNDDAAAHEDYMLIVAANCWNKMFSVLFKNVPKERNFKERFN